MSSADALTLFAVTLTAAGLLLNGPPFADGAMHRCGVAGKPRGRAGGRHG